MGKGNVQKPPRPLGSKTHSCSELKQSQKALLTVKKEHLEPEELDKKIQDSMMVVLVVQHWVYSCQPFKL